jgi:hypothetical protein
MNECNDIAEDGEPATNFNIGDWVLFRGRAEMVTGSAYWLGRSGWLLALDGGDYIYFWKSARLRRLD